MIVPGKAAVFCVSKVALTSYLFQVAVPFSPYLYVLVRKEFMQETSAFLSKKFSSFITGMQQVPKEDLDLANHLVGLKQGLHAHRS